MNAEKESAASPPPPGTFTVSLGELKADVELTAETALQSDGTLKTQITVIRTKLQLVPAMQEMPIDSLFGGRIAAGGAESPDGAS